jgi:hypothetical protein
MPRVTQRERKTQLSLAQSAGVEAKKSEGEPAASKAGSEEAEENDQPGDLTKAADADRQRVHASLDGKTAKLRGKHTAAAAKSVGAEENEASKADAQPGIARAVVTNAPERGTAAAPPAFVAVSPATEPAGAAFASESQAVALQKAQTAGPEVKQRAAPTVEQDRPAMAGAKHESAEMSAAIHSGAPVSHSNTEGSSSTSNGGPLHAAETATVAVPPSTSSHPAAVPARTGTRVDGIKAVEVPQVLESGPARLDVGVFDGTHGWLRIRAELGTGGSVNATLTAGATAHDSLRAVLPEMASYLQSEAVSVNRIALHRAAAGSNGMGTAAGQQNDDAPRQGAAGGQAQNSGSSSKEDLPATERGEARPVITASRDAVGAWSGGVPAMPGLGVGSGMLAGSRGSWLNVRA